MWRPVKDPSQAVLDRLLQEARREAGPCPSCKVEPGKQHTKTCDIARCTKCGGQRISCDCTMGTTDVWDGLWPGTMECYNKRLVVKFESGGVFAGQYMFDYNRQKVEKISETVKPTPERQGRKINWR